MEELLSSMKHHYERLGRAHLPWRATKNPYRILVSEVMLQQTQVERVLPFYTRFLRAYPTPARLAEAPLQDVLQLWQGLGYNRRARMLHETGKQLAAMKVFPRSVEAIVELPGVGPYTARAIAAFAYNQREVFIETNIRTVFIHHLYPRKKSVNDKELLPRIEEALALSGMEPREFYAALMDYGAHLKRSGVRLNNKSAHYKKQSAFKGSTRELRGAILRQLLLAPASAGALARTFGTTKLDLGKVLLRLCKEELIEFRGKKFRVKK